jgi:5,10-methenyltetrahydrofolate synthetase
MIPKSSSVAQVMGVTNAVTIDADAVKELTLVGPGAGGDATASAEVADIADIAKGIRSAPFGLPVADRIARTLKFHVWFPGCPMEPDAYDIPKPKDTAVFEPQMVLLPCIGYGPEGVRMGYGGGFYDRTVAALKPRPYVVGLSYSNGFLPMLRARSTDELVLDALLTDDGVVWQR